MEVPVYNMSGKQVGTYSIDAELLGGAVNPSLIKQAYVRYHANKRQGSARTKNRRLVEGSTRKLYRQKGTGNARAGAARTPIRRGGGRAFSKTKTREDYRLDMPVKMRRKANRNALLAKLLDGEVRIFDKLSFNSPKTKDFRTLLEACGIDRTCLAALSPDNTNGRLAARNLPDVAVCNAEQLTCWDMLNARYMIIAKEDLEAWIAGPGSVTDKRYSRKPSSERTEAEAA